MSDLVDLSERVTATYYDDEHEEWSQKTVTIADVLDSVCDDYTVLPSAQPEIVMCKDCKHGMYDMMCKFYWCHGVAHSANWFCADAERSEDAEIH